MSATTPGLYCEHGVFVTLDDVCRHGCVDTVPLCVGCGHEPHSPHNCVMLVEDSGDLPSGWEGWKNCGCDLDSYAGIGA